jgi:hypothetical protein
MCQFTHVAYASKALLAVRKETCMPDYESSEHQIHPETKWAGQAQSPKTMVIPSAAKSVLTGLWDRNSVSDKRDPQERADITNLRRQH